MEKYQLIVIGGGAAGLFAGANAAKLKTLILEKNNMPGRKLLMAGAGKCNFTHEGSIDEFFSKYGKNWRFLRNSLLKYDNYEVINFFRNRGVEIVVDKNGKVFPESGKGKDILETLINEIRKNGNVLKCGERVKNIKNENGLFYIETTDKIYSSEKVLVAVGGASYPTTGSSGDGYDLARSLGHTIVEPAPALTNINVIGHFLSKHSGVSFTGIEVSVWREGKKIIECRGDIGITHNGISGPGILDLSRYMEDGDNISINLSGMGYDECYRFLAEAAQNEGKSTMKKIIKKFPVPESVLESLLVYTNINADERCADVDKVRRKHLAEVLTKLEFTNIKRGGFDTAMVTRGGVSTKEIDSKTMESKIIKNLYFAGELIDIDGDTGGYNIQAAFSTAIAAIRAMED